MPLFVIKKEKKNYMPLFSNKYTNLISNPNFLHQIWEGKPVQIYETGQFKLVDGKFSP
jgi:hypothetical protein